MITHQQTALSSAEERAQAKTVVLRARPMAAEAPEPIIQADDLPAGGQAFLDHLVRLNLLSPSVAGNFLRDHAGRLPLFDDAKPTGEALVQAQLLTRYQLERILAGNTHGLVLGNYRV